MVRTMLGHGFLCLLTAVAYAQDGTTGFRIAVPSLNNEALIVRTLLRRSDVQNALLLDMRQRRELRAILEEPTAARVSVVAGGQDPLDESALRRHVDEQIRAQAQSPDDGIRKVLRPEQWERLQQLCLQWRGPLALADPAVAERTGIKPETRSEIAKVAGEYEGVKRQVFESLSHTRQQASPEGSPQTVAIRIDTAELERPLSPLRKKLEQAKSDAERRILRLLTAEERSRWDALCGKPFSFRTDLKGLRF